MNRTTLVLAILLASGLAAPLAAQHPTQPNDGDLILTFGPVGPGGAGFTACLRPGGNGGLTTIAVAAANSGHNWVRMAPDNRNLVIAHVGAASTNPRRFQSGLIDMNPGGAVTTLTGSFLPGFINGYELDHDDQWVVVGQNAATSRSQLMGVDQTTGAVTTFATLPTSGPEGMNGLTIDRDPGGPTYAVAWFTQSTLQSAKIFGADRRGVFTTIAVGAGNTLRFNQTIELHPRSGDYFVTDVKVSPADAVASRVTKGGVITPLDSGTLAGGNGARIGQDDTAWIAEGPVAPTSTTVAKYDFASNTVVATRTVNHAPAGCTGLEIYGSRPLTCVGSGKPGTSVRVDVRSRRAAAAGARYALAASFARRPGVKLGNGEWLDLAQDALFVTSAGNFAPTIFEGFRGTLDATGTGTARVNVPAQLPGGLDLTVFVAGIIFDGQGIVQVTQTHWIVLS